MANPSHKYNRAGAYTIPSWAIVQALGTPVAAPVPVKNSIWPTVTEFRRRRDTPAGRASSQR